MNWLLNPQQMVLVGGLAYFVLGYISNSWVRMGVGCVFIVGAIVLWEGVLRVTRSFLRSTMKLPYWVRLGLSGGGLTAYVLTTTTMPAHAVFLGRLCSLMLSVVNVGGAGMGQVDDLIRATVNVVRALFVLYLAIALIGVFNQMQRDEEWQVAARTPLLAVVIVGIVEAISTLIVPSNIVNTNQC